MLEWIAESSMEATDNVTMVTFFTIFCFSHLMLYLKTFEKL